MKLYELSKAYRDAEEAIFSESLDIETGEVVDVVSFDKFEQLKDEWDKKAEAVAIFIKETDAEEKAVAAEAAKLKRRAKVLERRGKYLKDYLVREFSEVGKKRLETARAKISVRAAKHVEILDAAKIPEVYKSVETVEKIDKTKLAKQLRTGAEVPGCAYVSQAFLLVK